MTHTNKNRQIPVCHIQFGPEKSKIMTKSSGCFLKNWIYDSISKISNEIQTSTSSLVKGRNMCDHRRFWWQFFALSTLLPCWAVCSETLPDCGYLTAFLVKGIPTGGSGHVVNLFAVKSWQISHLLHVSPCLHKYFLTVLFGFVHMFVPTTSIWRV